MSDPAEPVHAEQALLAALLLNPSAIGPVSRVVRVEDFALDSHAVIYRVLLELAAQHSGGYIALAAELECRGLLNGVGGRSYLLSLAASLPVGFDVGYNAALIKRLAAERREAHDQEQEQ